MRLAMARLIGVVPTLRKPRRVGHPQLGRASHSPDERWTFRKWNGKLKIADSWALNSAVECHPHTVEVVGSNPTAPTIFQVPRVRWSLWLAARRPRKRQGRIL